LRGSGANDTAARARLGFAGLLVVIGFVSIYWQQGANIPWGGIIFAISVIATGGTIGIMPILAIDLARAKKVAAIFAQEQSPIWMTGGSIAISNFSITPPEGTKWWWTERIIRVVRSNCE